MIFQKGDRVRVITRRHGEEQYRNTGTVTGPSTSPGWIAVDFDPGMHSRFNSSYQSFDLEHLTPFEKSVEAYITRELHS